MTAFNRGRDQRHITARFPQGSRKANYESRRDHTRKAKIGVI